ncbi:MAG: hypothetical protein J6L69_06740 [Lachnospiraceae bacterium]|nr:hypothetical protein [Lachnospiraceae bacterium]
MNQNENILVNEKKKHGFIESLRTVKNKVIATVSMGVLMSNVMVTQVFATTATTAASTTASTSSITEPLDNLKTLVIAVIGAVGVIILAKNVMEFAQAYQGQDSSTMNSALKGIVAGIMMAGISTVLAFLGF